MTNQEILELEVTTLKIHERVRVYIEEKGLKQTAVARRCGIPYITFNAMLRGKRKMYADDLIAICIALDEPPETFVNFLA